MTLFGKRREDKLINPSCTVGVAEMKTVGSELPQFTNSWVYLHPQANVRSPPCQDLGAECSEWLFSGGESRIFNSLFFRGESAPPCQQGSPFIHTFPPRAILVPSSVTGGSGPTEPMAGGRRWVLARGGRIRAAGSPRPDHGGASRKPEPAGPRRHRRRFEGNAGPERARSGWTVSRPGADRA
jgi:hypothetical protein